MMRPDDSSLDLLARSAPSHVLERILSDRRQSARDLVLPVPRLLRRESRPCVVCHKPFLPGEAYVLKDDGPVHARHPADVIPR